MSEFLIFYFSFGFGFWFAEISGGDIVEWCAPKWYHAILRFLIFVVGWPYGAIVRIHLFGLKP